ncbi:LysE family translocator [Pseudooceanicola aestuarii]|uniref:LysE family translocator n=1 Tax=Pseudooceanicola aestuarii TaxID=2697319 RepID=UPI0013D76892|nr:LysE family translocator [Pseudooceanicola aestuarii]
MLAEHLPQLLLAWSVQAAGVASPGPGVMLILGVATARGRAPALGLCLGIGAAAVLLALATAVGLATLLAEARIAMIAIKIAGAAYLLWLAWQSFRKAAHPPRLADVAAPATGRAGDIGLGFAMQMTNPKAILFWIAVAAVGGVGDAPAPMIALFVAGAFCISFGGHALWALLLSSAPFRALYARARRGVEATLGVFFTFFAVKLATTKV